MERFFNTAGPCRPEDHYMIPAEPRVGRLRQLIDQKLYFVVHAPRQSGKTTSLRTLAEMLTSEGRYAALLTSCEVGQKLQPNLEGSIAAILDNLRQRAESALPQPLRPPRIDASIPPETRLRDHLKRWAEICPRPLVLFFDEIDALYNEALISVLRQLRAGYDDRPAGFPHATALIGLRDVRDYRLAAQEDADSLGTTSPFNIKSDSLTLPNFTAEEVTELLAQHCRDTGQVFTAEARHKAFELTGGQPWLVNALARQLVETLVPDRNTPIDATHVDLAREILVRRRDTHFDSLLDRLRQERVRKVLQPILAGIFPADDVLNDDIQFVKDLGLVARGASGGLEIANPIYREIIPWALTAAMEEFLPVSTAAYRGSDGRLAWAKLLDSFNEFWRANAEWMLQRQKSYPEAAAQLVLMAYLHKVVNGLPDMPSVGSIPTIDREFAVGSGRVDLLVRWPLTSGEVERFAMEIKVRRGGEGDPLSAGLVQLASYLERLSLDRGTLAIFDQRPEAPPLAQRCSRTEMMDGPRRVTVLRL